MVEISIDLPDYLRSSHSIAHSKSFRYSRKNLKTPLTQGISEEAPDFFKVPRATVVTSSNKKILFNSENDRFILDLKKFQASPSRNFQYSDYKSCKYDYDSISCTKNIDLIADRRPQLRKTGEFSKLYEKYLEKGFGIIRGEFTVEYTNPKIVRNHSGKTKTLEQILRKTSRKKIFTKELKTAHDTNRKCNSMLRLRKSKPESNYLEDLDKFEISLPKHVSLANQRQTYIIDKGNV